MATDLKLAAGELRDDAHHHLYIDANAVRDDDSSTECSEADEEDAQVKEVRSVSTSVVVLTIVMVVAIMVDKILVQQWDWATSMYALVQVVTTIGYGDVSPKHEHSRMLCILLILGALTVLAHFMNDFANKCADREEAKLKEMLDESGHLTHAHERVKDSAVRKATFKIVRQSMIFGMFILGGTVFFATYENCSCSFGRTAIDGCDESSYEKCVQTGGQVKTWVDSLYMSIVTLTTVGFGDYTPQTWLGRLLAIPWMLLGVASTAGFVSAISSYLFDIAKTSESRSLENHDVLLKELDVDCDGVMSRGEHHIYMVLKLGLITDDLKQKLDDHFEQLARDDKEGVPAKPTVPAKLVHARDCDFDAS